jgi:Ca2+-binding EF-hand superfamily protein
MSLERVLSAGAVDANLLCFTVSRADKILLASSLSILRHTFKVDIGKYAKKALKGYCLLALNSWCFDESFDNGAEYRISELLELVGGGGKTRSEEVEREALEEIRNLLMDEHEALIRHVEKCGVTFEFPVLDEFELPVHAKVSQRRKSSKGSALKELSQKSQQATTATTSEEERSLAPTVTTAAVNNVGHPAHGDLLECLELWMALLDTDESQSITRDQFTEFVINQDVGYTKESIDNLLATAGWLEDGRIVYSDILPDLSTHMLHTMTEEGRSVDGCIDLMWGRYTSTAEQAWECCNPIDGTDPQAIFNTTTTWGHRLSVVYDEQEDRICSDLIGYLKDTFDSFDIHQCGYLNSLEFWRMMHYVFRRVERSGVEELKVCGL